MLLLLENEGITEQIRQAFIAYLFSHPRPSEELLAPRWKDIDGQYQGEFSGMARRSITVSELKMAAFSAFKILFSNFTEQEKILSSVFMIASHCGKIHRLSMRSIYQQLFETQNIAKMPEAKRESSQQALKKVLGV